MKNKDYGFYRAKAIPIQAVKVEKENKKKIRELLNKGKTKWIEKESGFVLCYTELNGLREYTEYGSGDWLSLGVNEKIYIHGDDFEERFEKVSKPKKETL